MGIRLLPAAVAHPRRAWNNYRRARERPTSHTILGAHFVVLADLPEELLLGLQGRFWTAGGGLGTVVPNTFAAGPPAGVAQAAWNFSVRADKSGSRLTTGTRVRTGDERTTRLLGRYWRVVGPFSGLMRHRMLAQIKHAAESETRTFLRSPSGTR